MTREELIEEAANAMSQGYVQDGLISSFFALAETALAVFEKAQASIDTVPRVALYHPDGTPKSNDEVRADAAEIRAKYADNATVMNAAEKIAGENVGLMERLAHTPTDQERRNARREAGECGNSECGQGLAHSGPCAPTDDDREALAHLIDPNALELAEYPWPMDAANRVIAAGFRRAAQPEPTTIQFAARQGGKSQALIDSMLAQANEHGIRVEVVYPQTEPTDAQAIAARDELQRRGYGGASLFAMRAALRAAFTAGQEANAAQLEAARHEGWKAARAEVRMIPSWYNSDTKQGGFDLQHGEVASEEGAWMEVMRVLNANPFTAGQEDKL